MPNYSGANAIIRKKTSDILCVEIINPCICNKTFVYKIISSEEKIVRKGNFIGPTVQLCIGFLQVGDYIFQLYDDQIMLQQCYFQNNML